MPETTAPTSAVAPPTVRVIGPEIERRLLQRLADDKLRMPPYPAVAMKLKRLAQQDRTSTSEIASALNADAALVAAVLRDANAAAYGAVSQIMSLDVAIGRLGIERIVEIAIAQSVGTVASSSGALRLLRRDLWRRSLLAAHIAAELAPPRGVDRDSAFVAGLLHDFGAITVLVALEDLDTELPVLSADTWRRFVEKLQDRFSRVFAERWSLPEPIRDAVEHWAHARDYAGTHRPLVTLISNVTAIISALDQAASFGFASLAEIEGLSDNEAERVQQLAPRIAGVMASFEPRTGDERQASAVETVTEEDQHWPIDYPAMAKREKAHAVAIGRNALHLVSAQALAVNWLVPVVVDSVPVVDLLANVVSCEPTANGEYEIRVRPFGLGGHAKEAWFAVIKHAQEPVAAPPADSDASASAPASDGGEEPAKASTSSRVPRPPVVRPLVPSGTVVTAPSDARRGRFARGHVVVAAVVALIAAVAGYAGFVA